MDESKVNFETLPLIQRTETPTATSSTLTTTSTTTASTGTTTAVIHPPPNQNADGVLQMDVDAIVSDQDQGGPK